MNNLNDLHLAIHPLDASATRSAPAQLGPLTLPTLQVSANWAVATLPLTFEEAVARLSELPHSYAEPDGSFAWVGTGAAPFRFEGILHDRGPRLSHVELFGHGGAIELLRLLEAVAGDVRQLMIQSVEEGRFFAVA